ncbi:Putative ribonuclease H protein [Dendrobium catenatum]|uniref:Ribonuclease H protein n=1 Tax=Dendrobium catenatum TaxID=906689 RepID=A0A2I0VGY6_9ASPA|nr:Putative ribonuclease H protein [Dendrobium catenatum]
MARLLLKCGFTLTTCLNILSTTHYNSITCLLKDWLIPTKGHIRNIIPVIICWYLWDSRNASKHDNMVMNVLNVIAKVKNKILQLYGANLIKVESFKNCIHVANEFGLNLNLHPTTRKDKLIHWRLPVVGCFKLNTDGSYNKVNARCGGIIRDYSGKVVEAFAGPSSGINAIQAEVDSLLYGVQLCLTLGLYNIWVEVDAMLLIHYIEGKTSLNPSNFYKIRDIKHCLSLISYYISHIMREGNAVADGLAKLGCSLTGFFDFNDHSLPREIKGLIKLDQLGLPYIRFY